MRLAMESLIRGPYADYLHNTLNEVLHGFMVDLEQEFRNGYEDLRALMRELDAADSHYQLSSEKAALLLRASELCDREFEDGELHTRLGYTRAEAHAVMHELKELAQGAGPITMRSSTQPVVSSSTVPNSGREYIENLR